MKTPRVLVALSALVVSSVAVLAVVPGAEAPQASAADPVTAATGLLVGDSMTVHASAEIEREFPGWEVDGEGGRRAARVIHLLREYKAAHGSVPPVVVIALGSNEQRYFRRLYQYAVDMVPAKTTVVFQSLWRDPAVWPDRAPTMGRLTHKMHQVADRRDGVCVAGWRSRARAKHDVLVADGVHPTPQGRTVWVRTLRRALEDCR